MKRSLNNKRRKEKILKLRAEGKSFREIAKELGCSKGLISYHCGNGNENKRARSQYKKRNPLCKKVSNFKCRCSRSNYKAISSKLKTFKRKPLRSGNPSDTVVNNISKNYNCKDVIEKLGEQPICYLTGEKIDLAKPESYHLDHITPSSKGGTNDLDNLQICLKEANYAKGELLLEDFYVLCEKVLKWRDKNRIL
jgi:hypothetical protein